MSVRGAAARPALAVLAWAALLGAASAEGPASGAPEKTIFGSPNVSLHFQSTVIDQAHAAFSAAYSGPNSQSSASEHAVSITSTMFLAWRPRMGTELCLDPELAGGKGLSGALGIAGFTNGETFRIGDPAAVVSVARVFIRQTFGFGAETERIEEGPNQVAGTTAARRLSVAAGKFGLADYFDNNAYSHDPRAQFLNWALMSSGAWDYPADTRGYTWGLMAEYRTPGWAARAAAAAEPRGANQLELDRSIGKAHGFVVEGERRTGLRGREGTARLLLFFNQADMGSYAQALNDPGLDLAPSRSYAHTKYGAALSADQPLADDWGGFLRLSWSDGSSETWAFTEIDRSEAAGLEWRLVRLGRPEDRLGIGAVANELSDLHRRFLAAGGHGFMLGDGALSYAPEMIAEVYYRLKVTDKVWVSPDYQFVLNPGYNSDRGPIHVWALRTHAEF